MEDIVNTHFGFKNTPFLNCIPDSCLLHTNKMNIAIGTLNHIAANNQLCVLTGDVGVGKSCLLRMFVSSLDKSKYQVFYISDSQLTPRCLYNQLLSQVGISGKMFRGDCKRLFQTELENISDTLKKQVVVIIDESHLIPIESLQEIRFLLNTKMDSCSPLSIILCGQDELWPKLKREECKAIRQRVDMTVRLKPLEKSDIAAYLDAHLSYAGGSREIFNAGAVKAIAKYSSGIMRVINKICTHSLLTAVDEGLKIVTEELIEKVVNSPRNENLMFGC